MDEREVEFLRLLFDLMDTAHYQLLNQMHWEIATSENFMFFMPISIDWTALDEGFIKSFWESHAAARAELHDTLPKELQDKVLVFHRGVGVEKIRGRFINEKIDLLSEYLVLGPIKRLLGKAPPAIKDQTFNLAGDDAAEHKFVRRVQRKTLTQQLPNWFMVIRNLFKVMELQEPAFKDVVVVYRLKTPEIARTADASTQPPEQRLANILQIRNINVKSFGSVPFADVEVIFPNKQIFIKSTSLLSLIGTLVAAFIGAAITLWKVRLQQGWVSGKQTCRSVSKQPSFGKAGCGCVGVGVGVGGG
jgi:hypothetical protein